MNSMSTIEESIQQLHDTTNRHQIAINTIQATLETQQQDITDIKTAIVDIRTSINHIIHSVSEIATKLGFQITLPPLLPLSPTPPTLLPAASTSSITAATPLPKPDTPPVSTVAAPFLHQPSLSTMAPSSPIQQSNSTHQLLKSFSDTRIESGLDNPETQARYFSKIASLIQSDTYSFGVMLFEVLCARPALNPCLPKEQEWDDELTGNYELKLFYLMPGRNEMKTFGKNVFIFDPGGCTINVSNAFDVWLKYSDLQLDDDESGKKITEGFKERGYVDQAFDEMQHRNCTVWSETVVVTIFQFLNERSDAAPRIFVTACSIDLRESNSSQAQKFILCYLCHNSPSITLMPSPLAYDLEDKVDFKGMVMIRVLWHLELVQPKLLLITVPEGTTRLKCTITTPARYRD